MSQLNSFRVHTEAFHAPRFALKRHKSAQRRAIGHKRTPNESACPSGVALLRLLALALAFRLTRGCFGTRSQLAGAAAFGTNSGISGLTVLAPSLARVLALLLVAEETRLAFVTYAMS